MGADTLHMLLPCAACHPMLRPGCVLSIEVAIWRCDLTTCDDTIDKHLKAAATTAGCAAMLLLERCPYCYTRYMQRILKLDWRYDAPCDCYETTIPIGFAIIGEELSRVHFVA